ncbi:Porin B precursor [Poriferisphaera corsica]|uniref:Porin B n=1 Tax=Poriferisphaera corsica TaxID=2528020 RepID=A0A517YZI2_9BACT|nr:carbohydrate porin [Poriferisphaera corsica]QDU35593.1 Porin B precursor [Poriferisphaera corsica]
MYHKTVFGVLGLLAGLSMGNGDVQGQVTEEAVISVPIWDWVVMEREALADRGVEVEVGVTIDYSMNLMGGVSTSADALRSLVDVGVGIDLEKMFGLKGANAYVLMQSISGDDGSEVLTGDAQAFSNIDFGDNRAQISEVWWEQELDELGRFAMKMGKIDVNADFGFVDYGGEFVNSSAGFSPTTLGLPTYPETAFGGSVYMRATEDNPVYMSVGIFDGSNMQGIRTGLRGPSSFIDGQGDLYLIAEGGMNWKLRNGLEGRFGVGVWRFTGDVQRLDGQGVEEGTDGMYAVFDQALYREEIGGDEGLSMFGMFGYADDAVAEIDQHIGMGFVYQGLIEGRGEDVCGVMGTWVGFSDDAGLEGDGEFAAEVFYKAVLWDWMSLKPDVQWIANPGGEEGKDALVTTLRAEFSF